MTEAEPLFSDMLLLCVQLYNVDPHSHPRAFFLRVSHVCKSALMRYQYCVLRSLRVLLGSLLFLAGAAVSVVPLQARHWHERGVADSGR